MKLVIQEEQGIYPRLVFSTAREFCNNGLSHVRLSMFLDNLDCIPTRIHDNQLGLTGYPPSCTFIDWKNVLSTAVQSLELVIRADPGHSGCWQAVSEMIQLSVAIIPQQRSLAP